MASYSQYKNLELPTSPEHYDIAVFNKNSIVIDSELHKLDLKNQSQDESFATKEILDSKLSTHNNSDSSHSDMRLLISGLTTQSTNLNGLITNLVSIVENKVDNIVGKGLSTNDFTDEKNEKLEGIAANANHTIYTNNLLATIPGTALDAMQGKALDDKGAQMSVYKGEDGNLHFRDWTGADTVIPFSGGGTAKINITASGDIHDHLGNHIYPSINFTVSINFSNKTCSISSKSPSNPSNNYTIWTASQNAYISSFSFD